jgi:outer membrane protein OmpA-like peptidoglycan-associated protein
MKTSPPVLIAAFLLFQSVSAHAAGVYQMDYRYPFDDMAGDGARRKTFVICDDACVAESPLAPAPRFPALSIRVSQDLPVSPGKEATQKEPNVGISESSLKKNTYNGEHAADARITVLFGLDSSALSDAEKAKLSSFVKSLGAETRAGNLFVTGYTCDLGTKAHNDALAMKRAETVETYLRKAGLHAMWVTGTGKCCYATKDQGKRYLNRRAEVTISKREATK